MGIDRRQASVEPRSFRAALVDPSDELTLRVLVDAVVTACRVRTLD
ncbi:MAG: hypothetical protein SPK00_04770 [Corynebacterium glucuronolyticum]|nr:hypothetical protein [Corynebacterium glucuronolyticum]MDD7586829.1 hypothetical protein [Mycobacteriaceae bacterium]MDY5834048.1 hypothetical protein [Corynebacterium glucuronolyticum]